MRRWVKLIYLVSVYTDRYTLVYAIILTPFYKKKYICLVKKAEPKWQQSEFATARYFIKCKQLDYYVSFVDVVWLSRGSSNFGIIWVYDGEGFLSFVGPSTVFPSIYAMHPHDNLCFYDTLLNVFFFSSMMSTHTYDVYLSCQFAVAVFFSCCCFFSSAFDEIIVSSSAWMQMHCEDIYLFKTTKLNSYVCTNVIPDMASTSAAKHVVITNFEHIFFLHLFFEVLYTIDLWLFSLSTLLLHFLKVVFFRIVYNNLNTHWHARSRPHCSPFRLFACKHHQSQKFKIPRKKKREK